MRINSDFYKLKRNARFRAQQLELNQMRTPKSNFGGKDIQKLREFGQASALGSLRSFQQEKGILKTIYKNIHNQQQFNQTLTMKEQKIYFETFYHQNKSSKVSYYDKVKQLNEINTHYQKPTLSSPQKLHNSLQIDNQWGQNSKIQTSSLTLIRVKQAKLIEEFLQLDKLTTIQLAVFLAQFFDFKDLNQSVLDLAASLMILPANQSHNLSFLYLTLMVLFDPLYKNAQQIQSLLLLFFPNQPEEIKTLIKNYHQTIFLKLNLPTDDKYQPPQPKEVYLQEIEFQLTQGDPYFFKQLQQLVLQQLQEKEESANVINKKADIINVDPYQMKYTESSQKTTKKASFFIQCRHPDFKQYLNAEKLNETVELKIRMGKKTEKKNVEVFQLPNFINRNFKMNEFDKRSLYENIILGSY